MSNHIEIEVPEVDERVQLTYPGHKIVSTSLRAEQYLRLNRFTKATGKTTGRVIREAILFYLDSEEEKEKAAHASKAR